MFLSLAWDNEAPLSAPNTITNGYNIMVNNDFISSTPSPSLYWWFYSDYPIHTNINFRRFNSLSNNTYTR